MIRRLLSNLVVRFYILIALTVFIILYRHDKKIGFENVDWEGIWVEAHGMFFDILILGLFFTIYDQFIVKKREEIEKLQSEIDAYRFWKEPEAAHRIRDVIVKLNKLGISRINLNGCFLKGTTLLEGSLERSYLIETNFEEVKFASINFGNCSFEKVNFKNAKLFTTFFAYSRIGYADFTNAELVCANFAASKIYETTMQNAVLYFADFRMAEFNKVNLEGAKAYEYQKSILESCGANTEKMIFEANPSDFEQNKELYLSGRGLDVHLNMIEKDIQERRKERLKRK